MKRIIAPSPRWGEVARNTLAVFTMAFLVFGGFGGALVPAVSTVSADHTVDPINTEGTALNNQDGVVICHSGSGKKYQKFEPNIDSILNGTAHGDNGHDNDVVPAFYWNDGENTVLYHGRNWTLEGQDIWDNESCEGDGVVEDDPEPGTIIVDKVTDPSEDPTEFTFNPSWTEDFTLTDTDTPHNSGDLDPNTSYSVIETVPDGWTLDSVTCDDDDGNDNTNIQLDEGETVTCTFNNSKDPVEPGTIIVVKDTDPNDETLFEFTSNTLTSPFTLQDDGDEDDGDVSSKEFSELNAGTYDVSETSNQDYNTSASCDDGSDPSSIDLSSGETVTCTFTNTFIEPELGSISGTKFDSDTELGLSEWTIFIDENDNQTLDNEETSVTTDGDGNYSFSNLQDGTYSVCEVVESGWTQILPDTTNGCHEVVISQGSNSIENDFWNQEDPEEPDPTLDFQCSEDQKDMLYIDISPADEAILYTVDTSGNAVEQIRYDGDYHPALAIDENSDLYGISEAPGKPLVQFNPDGTVTEIGDTDLPNPVAMSFAPDGTLYVLDEDNDDDGQDGSLHIISTTDGSVTEVLLSGDDPRVSGGDLVVDENNDLIYVHYLGLVYLIDLDTNILTELDGTLSGPFFTSTAYVDGQHYAYNKNTDDLVPFSVDKNAGTATEGSAIDIDPAVIENGDATNCVPVEEPPVIPECSDDQDNDGDGLIDEEDPGCHTDGDPDNPDSYDPDDDDETDEPIDLPECSDGIDNDGDGLIDEEDPGCHTDGDPDDGDDTYDPDDDDETDEDDGGGSSRPGQRTRSAPSGAVLGAATEQCGMYLEDFLRIDFANNPVQVNKLHDFLNEYEGENLPLNGIFTQDTFNAVTRFQSGYLGDVLAPWGLGQPTGFVYITTRHMINKIVCEEWALAHPYERPLIPYSARPQG